MSRVSRVNLINVFIFLVTFIILILSENVLSKPVSKQEETTLEMVAILHRHGLRTPIRTYKTDPYNNQTKYWPIGWGQLTLRGKQQLYKLGKLMGYRYKQFVPKYTVQTVRVNSSDILRCHMSVGALLAGMFPPQKDQVWTDELKWQPIPIHSVPTVQDKVIALRAPCPRYTEEKNKADDVIFNKVLTTTDKLVLKYLTDHMGETMSINTVNSYWATLLIEQLHGLELPKWANTVFPEPMTRIAGIGAASFAWNDILQKFQGGPMIKEIFQQFTDKIEGKNGDMKLFIYSAHDSTILSVWRALKFQERLIPDFGSAMLFELHKNKYNEYFIKLLYMNNTYMEEPHPLKIPGCESPCNLNTFSELTEYVRDIDWDIDCWLNTTTSQ